MATIATLQELLVRQAAEYDAKVAKLEARVQELEAQLKSNSSNSSKPPSSDPPWIGAKGGKRQGRKRGGQPGHRGHRRELVEPDAVVEHRPEACKHCHAGLTGDDADPRRHQVTEVPPVKPVVTEHRVHTLRCGECGQRTTGTLPAEVTRSAFGPRLQAMIAMCSAGYRLSKRTIVELVHRFFGVTIALGSICRVEHQMSCALAHSRQEALTHVANARVVHVDETGWPLRASPGWLWTAVTARVVVFMVDEHRSREASFKLVPETFGGALVADRYAAYNWIHPARRQFCWAHLLRQFRALLDYGAVAQAFAERLLAATDRLFASWHRVNQRALNEIRSALAPSRDEFHALLSEGRTSTSAKVRSQCGSLLRHEPSLWTFAERADVEPTNNAAERALRPAVLWRKGSFGCDSARGARFVERLLTVIASLRLQGRDVLDFLVDARRAALVGAQPPPIWIHP
jgi:transposase